MWRDCEGIDDDAHATRVRSGPPQPGQTVKVAANQAWFEYIPARVKAPSGSLDTFGAVAVRNVPIEKWDDGGLGLPKDHPLRSLFLADRPAGGPEWTYNMLLKHGVRSCLEYAKSFPN